MTGHAHCPAPGCYWRIQHLPTCSRCGGTTITRPGCCPAPGGAADAPEPRR